MKVNGPYRPIPFDYGAAFSFNKEEGTLVLTVYECSSGMAAEKFEFSAAAAEDLKTNFEVQLEAMQTILGRIPRHASA